MAETSAVASEIMLDAMLLGQLSERERIVERRQMSRDTMRRLYDGTLCLYSVLAHFVANRTSEQDAFVTYMRSSRLATLCLNLPSVAYDMLRIPRLLATVEPAVKQRFAMRDPSFAFAAIAAHGPEDSSLSADSWVSAAATAAGLPGMDELIQCARAEMEALEREVKAGPEADRLRALLRSGRRVHERRGFAGQNTMDVVLPYDTIQDYPPLLLGSGELVQLGAPLDGFSLEMIMEWIERAFTYHLRILEFCEACLP